MKRFIESMDRTQVTLFPEQLEDYVADDNPVRVVDVFVVHLDLGANQRPIFSSFSVGHTDQ
jgi:transposase